MKTTFSFLTIFSLATALVGQSDTTDHTIGKQILSIGFGSCADQDKDQPILELASVREPDLFIFLGDNIYGDSFNPDTLRNKYRRWAVKPGFQKINKTSELLATWDDHDYGMNDGGRHYSLKDTSKSIFLEFWKEPKTSPRWQRKGIYTSYLYEHEGHKVQIILLDTRTFRDNLLAFGGGPQESKFNYSLDYRQHLSSDSTMLGVDQWKWLEGQLKIEADVRIIGSSTQFGISYNGYEAWANFPYERKKLMKLIKSTKANGVVFISGDVHYAELSRLQIAEAYPIYDLTSSGITQTWSFAAPNENRVQGPVMENNFGLIELDWEKRTIQLEIWTMENRKIRKKLKMDKLHVAN